MFEEAASISLNHYLILSCGAFVLGSLIIALKKELLFICAGFILMALSTMQLALVFAAYTKTYGGYILAANTLFILTIYLLYIAKNFMKKFERS